MGRIFQFKSFTAVFIASVLFTASCQKDPETTTDPLDQKLEAQLYSASNDQGPEFFRLPDADELDKIPQDSRNPLTHEKIKLGKFLYHETHMALKPKYASGLHSYSCASCHHAEGGFQANRKQGIADGGLGYGNHGEGRVVNPDYHPDSVDFQPIASPTVLNTAYQELMLWNGQFGATGANAGTEDRWTAGTPKEHNHHGYEGLETQAMAGIGVHRMQVEETLFTEANYRQYFDAAFPDIPVGDRYSTLNAALAIAAYERSILANQAPFQKWIRGDKSAMTSAQKRGALLFFGKAQCNNCHTGPALSSMEFYALGMNDLEGADVLGTVDAATKKGRGGFTGVEADNYKFKVPQLYSLKYNPFYGHGSSFTTVEEVIRYKNEAVAENSAVPSHQLAPDFRKLNLTEEEIMDLVVFVRDALDDANLLRYEPAMTPSGYCFPNNDPQSAQDRGCN